MPSRCNHHCDHLGFQRMFRHKFIAARDIGALSRWRGHWHAVAVTGVVAPRVGVRAMFSTASEEIGNIVEVLDREIELEKVRCAPPVYPPT